VILSGKTAAGTAELKKEAGLSRLPHIERKDFMLFIYGAMT